MIQILHDNTHMTRAKVLAQTITTDAEYASIDTQAKSNAITTIIFWGHGDSYGLCGKTDDKLTEIIQKWHKKNKSTLKTIEIITCNARHSQTGIQPAFVDALSEKTLTKRVKLKRIKIKLRDALKIKALPAMDLPLNKQGVRHAYSVLLAETETNTWVYLAAPAGKPENWPGSGDDGYLMSAKNLFDFKKVGSKSISYRGRLDTRAAELNTELFVGKAVTDTPRWQIISSGELKDLRDALVDVI